MARRTTTTTIIRTAQNTGGSRRRSGSGSRRRTSRAKPRTRLTTTRAQRTQWKESAQKTNYLPLLGLAGLLGLGAIFLLPRLARADEGEPTPPGGGGGIPGGGGVQPIPGGGGVQPIPGGGGNTSPGGFVHPPAGTRATVNATLGIPAGQSPGLNLRSAPSPTASMVGAPLPNGTPITVVQSNVLEQGRTANDKERWWQVSTGGRTGFVRTVGPSVSSDRNSRYVWNVNFPGQTTATGRMMQAPPGLEANYTQMFRGYDAYNRPIDQFGRPMTMQAVDPYQALVRRSWGAG